MTGVGKRLLAAATLGVALWSLPLQAQTGERVSMTVDVSQSGPRISRDVFGQFAEMLGEGINGGIWVGPDSKIPNVRGIRSDVVAALRELHIPNVRWPGGCFADRYNWRDGIGAQSARKSHINMWGNVVEPNAFGTHEFMDFVEQIGSEAYVSVNMGSGTAQQAADWLEYMTATGTTLANERAANGHPAPWRIKFVGLGNETWGCGGGMSAEHNVEEMQRFSTFVTSYHPDQALQIGRPSAWPMRKVAVGWEIGKVPFSEAMMKAWTVSPWTGQGNFDALSLHYYTGDPQPLTNPSMDFGEKDYAAILRNTLKMEDMLNEHEAMMDRYDPDKKVALSIDEWGVWLKPTGENFLFLRQQNSMRDAVAAALNLNIFARHAARVRMANIAQMVNVIQSMILTDGAKMLRTPTYHIFKMYVPFQDATLIPLRFDAGEYRFEGTTLPRIDAIAAKATDAKIWLALTNVDPSRPTDIDVNALGFTARKAIGNALTAEKVDTVNSFDAPNAVSPKAVSVQASGKALLLHLPPKSVTVVQLQP